MAMTDSEYPPDFAGLVQAATAAADEQTYPPDPPSTLALTRSNKRKRASDDDLLDPSLSTDITDTPHQLSDAASALFKPASSASKKYSRPPLGTVYQNLGLAPDVFLRLQGALKSYMLDPAHPERRDVVGHKRHSGGTEAAKLKLWNCVDEFLKAKPDDSSTIHAEIFFPKPPSNDIERQAELEAEGKMYWPSDRDVIIKAVMPLMRKVVTNERQRIYAVESRTKLKPQFDIQDLQQGQSSENAMGDQNGSSTPGRINPIGSVVLHVNLMSSETGISRRLIPRFSLSPETAPNLSSLRLRTREHAASMGVNVTAKMAKDSSVKVWMSDGVLKVENDGEWMVALLTVGTVEWMDGEVKVLIEV
jgi:hypothetical protein